MLIGYMRVSKNDGFQTLDLQRDAFIASGGYEKHFYHDCVSSKKDSRPSLESCFKALQPENILIVWKLDCLGRNLKELVTIIDELR